MKSNKFSNKKEDIVCSRCGEMNLHWEETAKGWRLFTPEGNMHSCYDLEKKESTFDKKSWKWQKNKG